jgi:hypothetical protein
MSNTTTTKTPKLTTLESRAQEYAQALVNQINSEYGTGRAGFTISYKKSKTWGYCPSILNWRGEKVAYASGCGYCKTSAVMADFLRWLYPHGSDEHSKIARTSAAGEPSVINALKELGWTLEQTFNGKTEDGWTLSKIK